MDDDNTTRAQFIEEIAMLRQRVAELENTNVSRDQTERDLAASQMPYQALFDHALDAIIIEDVAGRVINANPTACALFGYTPDEWRGLSVVNLTDAAGQATVKQLIAEKPESACLEMRARRKDSSMFDIELASFRVFIDGQDMIFAHIRDITQRKRMGEALSASERQMSTLLSNLPGIAYRCSNHHDWPMEFISEGCYALTGYDSNELIRADGVRYGDLIHPDDRQYVWDAVQESIRQHKPFQLEYRITARDGTEKWLWEQGRCINCDAPPFYLEGFITDITDKVRAERALRESEERYRLLFDGANDLILMHELAAEDQPAHFIAVNDTAAQTLGYTKEELLALSPFKIIAPPSLADVPAERAHLESKGELSFTTKLITRDGNAVPVEIHSRLFQHQGKQRVISIARDITEQQQAEAALRASERRLHQILENMPVLLDATDENNTIIAWNRECERVTGYTADEMIDNPRALEILYPDEAYRREMMEQFIRFRGEFRDWEIELTRKDGQKRTILWSNISPQFPVNGWSSWAVGLDITDRKQAEEAVVERQRFIDAIAIANPSILYVYDLIERRIIWINRSTEQILRHDPEDILNVNVESLLFQNLMHPDDQAKLSEHFHQFDQMSDHAIFTIEHRLRAVNGSWRWFRGYHSVLKRLPNGKIQQIVGTLIDVTEQKHIEHTLRDSEAQLRGIVNAVYIGIGLVKDRVFVWTNEGFRGLTGYDAAELEGQSTRIIYPSQEEYERVGRELYTVDDPTSVRTCEGQFQHKDGRLIDVQLTLAPIVLEQIGAGFIVTAFDLTERKYLEKQLRHAQKMEAIGQLAGGIAHDFNNTLQWISGYAELSLEAFPHEAQLHELLGQVLNGVERASEMIKQLLAFSRQSEQERKSLFLQTAVKEALKFLRGVLPSNIEIMMDIHDCDAVLADPIRIHQVVMNLCTNAWQAMVEDGGALYVSLDQIEVTSEQTAGIADLKAGQYACLSIRDTGQGMDEATKARIFEPYFTTKADLGGTGLGLAVVYGIVQSHYAAIMVESAPGEGSTFTIYFPILTSSYGVGQEAQLLQAAVRGNERVLLVDDEEGITQAVTQGLERLGYKVTACYDSRDAAALFFESPFSFDIVVTDMIMPHMTGLRLARAMRKVRPELPIILCSGFSELIDETETQALDIQRVLIKPFRHNELALAIREVLAHGTSIESDY